MTNAARLGYETTYRIEKLKDGNLRLAFSTKLAHPVNNADLWEIWDYYVTHNEKRLSLNTLDKLKKHWRNAL